VRGLIAGVVLASLMIACGGAPAPNGPDFQRELRERKMTQIIDLWTQIREFRQKAHMELNPSQLTLSQMGVQTVREAKRVCIDTHAVPQVCSDVCGLADAICDNAEAICGLADELGKDDQMAQEKCTNAKASCRESQQKCCNCSKQAPAEGPLNMSPIPASGATSP